jgi:hypothetical protein
VLGNRNSAITEKGVLGWLGLEVVYKPKQKKGRLMEVIDLSLNNTALYKGCETKEVGGRISLTTAPNEAANIIGRNAQKIISEHTDRSAVTLTGPMAVWAYLVVFHLVVHKYSQVWYSDGRGEPIQIAQH